jgi:hypothetical protein
VTILITLTERLTFLGMAVSFGGLSDDQEAAKLDDAA